MFSESSSGTALFAVAIATGLTLVLFLYALGLRIAHTLYARELKRLRARWWPVIARAAIAKKLEPGFDLRPLQRGSRIKLLGEWCRFRGQITGQPNSLEHIADQLGLRNLARRLVKRHAVSQKLLGIQALGLMRDVESWDDLEFYLDHPNVSVSITAAFALVHTDAKAASALIIPMIPGRPTWPRTQVGRILKIAGPDTVTRPLCDAIRVGTDEVACALLTYYESTAIEIFDELLTHLLETRYSPAVLAAALKSIRGRLPVRIIEQLARHDVWFVRMQAATLLGRLGQREHYKILEPLLADSEWWVRYRAAQAVVRLPFLGPHALRKLRDRQDDAYARDILCQTLAEVGLA